jgi:hypothetical protein
MQNPNNRLFLHCQAGIHRTGVFAYCLLRLTGHQPIAAVAALRALRRATSIGVGEQRIRWAEQSVVAAFHHGPEKMMKDVPQEESKALDTGNSGQDNVNSEEAECIEPVESNSPDSDTEDLSALAPPDSSTVDYASEFPSFTFPSRPSEQ